MPATFARASRTRRARRRGCRARGPASGQCCDGVERGEHVARVAGARAVVLAMPASSRAASGCLRKGRRIEEFSSPPAASRTTLVSGTARASTTQGGAARSLLDRDDEARTPVAASAHPGKPVRASSSRTLRRRKVAAAASAMPPREAARPLTRSARRGPWPLWPSRGTPSKRTVEAGRRAKMPDSRGFFVHQRRGAPT